MTGYGPPDDPSEAPTGYIDYGDDGQLPPHPGSPWYRRPIVLLTLGLFAALLLGLAIYVVADRSNGHGGSTPTSTSPTTSTAVTTSTPATTTTDVPVAPAPTTTLTTPPTTGEPTTTAPTTTAPTSTSIDEGHHHHRHHDDGGTP